jgi:hypothetical protein
MGSNPLVRSSAIGIAMQLAMVILGKLVPSIGTIPNFYAIAGTVLAALTGSMAARATVGSTGAGATNGAVAGGVSSVIGGLAAFATGQWPGFAVLQLLFPATSGAVGGGLGGMVSKMMAGKSRAA